MRKHNPILLNPPPAPPLSAYDCLLLDVPYLARRAALVAQNMAITARYFAAKTPAQATLIAAQLATHDAMLRDLDIAQGLPAVTLPLPVRWVAPTARPEFGQRERAA